MTLDAIEAGSIWSRGDVFTAFEEFERLSMTVAAHLKGRGSIGARNESGAVALRFIRLRGIATVTSIARDTRLCVRACTINSNYLIARVTRNAVVGSLGKWFSFADYRRDVRAEPKCRDNQ